MGLLWQDVSSAVSFDANFLIFLIFMFDYPFIHRLIRGMDGSIHIWTFFI